MRSWQLFLGLSLVACSNSDGEQPAGAPPDTTGEEALVTCAPAAPSTKPDELINYCKALPGVNANGVLDCIKAAAASMTPAVVINHCASVPGFNAEAQLACIAAASNTPRP